MPAAQQFFEETFRPAKLLLDVYRLLDNDAVMTEHWAGRTGFDQRYSYNVQTPE